MVRRRFVGGARRHGRDRDITMKKSRGISSGRYNMYGEEIGIDGLPYLFEPNKIYKVPPGKHIAEPMSATEMREALGITEEELAAAREAIANTEE